MKEIYGKDISEKKEFRTEGDLLKQVECLNEENHIWLYERYSGYSGALIGYEVVKGKKCVNPDGSVAYLYPSSTDFGKYGKFIAKKFKDDIQKVVAEWTQRAQKRSK